MEPQLFSRGNMDIKEAIKFEFCASMEPQLFSRGNVWLVLVLRPSTLTLQWSRSFSAAEITVAVPPVLPLPSASMEPQLFSRGNFSTWSNNSETGLASMEPQLFSRGNLEYCAKTEGTDQASMEPQLFSRGNDVYGK